MMVGVHIPPRTRCRTEDHVRVAIAALVEVAAEALELAGELYVMGDVNAKVGKCPGQVPDDLAYLHPELLTPRSCVLTASPDEAGHALLSAVAAWKGVLLTGRNAQGEGDDDRPTCREASRPDHIALTEGLYRLAYHVLHSPSRTRRVTHHGLTAYPYVCLFLAQPSPKPGPKKVGEVPGHPLCFGLLSEQRSKEQRCSRCALKAALPECYKLVRGTMWTLLTKPCWSVYGKLLMHRGWAWLE
jgi:hypothetical protein